MSDMRDAGGNDGVDGYSTLSVLVENEPGVLARVIGLFSARGYNIESLSVSAVSMDQKLSRMTIVTSGNAQVVAQIEAQLSRLVPVYRVANLGSDCIAQELALFKIELKKASMLDEFRSLVSSHEGVILFEEGCVLIVRLISGLGGVDDFVSAATSFGGVEAARTGVVALGHGALFFDLSQRRG